ncbi:MAG: hypothetical protein ACREVY_00270 [Gammaproteobacteria bacterium]
MTRTQAVAVDEIRLSRLIDQRYGDGQIYLKDANEQPVLQAAIYLGLVSEEGYMTRHGKRLWAQHMGG